MQAVDVVLWTIIGGTLTPVLRKRLGPRLGAIPLDWRVRFVLLCTAMALLEEVITTTMTNLAPLLGTTPDSRNQMPEASKNTVNWRTGIQ